MNTSQRIINVMIVLLLVVNVKNMIDVLNASRMHISQLHINVLDVLLIVMVHVKFKILTILNALMDVQEGILKKMETVTNVSIHVKPVRIVNHSVFFAILDIIMNMNQFILPIARIVIKKQQRIVEIVIHQIIHVNNVLQALFLPMKEIQKYVQFVVINVLVLKVNILIGKMANVIHAILIVKNVNSQNILVLNAYQINFSMKIEKNVQIVKPHA